jgi:hypothetical protein
MLLLLLLLSQQVGHKWIDGSNQLVAGAVVQGAAPVNSSTICSSTSYSFTAGFGPFAACSTMQVSCLLFKHSYQAAWLDTHAQIVCSVTSNLLQRTIHGQCTAACISSGTFPYCVDSALRFGRQQTMMQRPCVMGKHSPEHYLYWL